jgi:hypothetical protein
MYVIFVVLYKCKCVIRTNVFIYLMEQSIEFVVYVKLVMIKNQLEFASFAQPNVPLTVHLIVRKASLFHVPTAVSISIVISRVTICNLRIDVGLVPSSFSYIKWAKMADYLIGGS